MFVCACLTASIISWDLNETMHDLDATKAVTAQSSYGLNSWHPVLIIILTSHFSRKHSYVPSNYHSVYLPFTPSLSFSCLHAFFPNIFHPLPCAEPSSPCQLFKPSTIFFWKETQQINLKQCSLSACFHEEKWIRSYQKYCTTRLLLNCGTSTSLKYITFLASNTLYSFRVQ